MLEPAARARSRSAPARRWAAAVLARTRAGARRPATRSRQRARCSRPPKAYRLSFGYCCCSGSASLAAPFGCRWAWSCPTADDAAERAVRRRSGDGAARAWPRLRAGPITRSSAHARFVRGPEGRAAPREGATRPRARRRSRRRPASHQGGVVEHRTYEELRKRSGLGTGATATRPALKKEHASANRRKIGAMRGSAWRRLTQRSAMAAACDDGGGRRRRLLQRSGDDGDDRRRPGSCESLVAKAAQLRLAHERPDCETKRPGTRACDTQCTANASCGDLEHMRVRDQAATARPECFGACGSDDELTCADGSRQLHAGAALRRLRRLQRRLGESNCAEFNCDEERK